MEIATFLLKFITPEGDQCSVTNATNLDTLSSGAEVKDVVAIVLHLTPLMDLTQPAQSWQHLTDTLAATAKVTTVPEPPSAPYSKKE